MPSKAVEVMDLSEVKAALSDPTIRLTVVEEDPEVVQRRMIEQTLSTRTVEELWGTGAISAKDNVDRTFTLNSVEFRNSEVEGASLGIFAVMHIVLQDTGEITVMTCGAAGVVTRLVKLIEFDALPIRLRISATKTKGGYTALDLVPVRDL